MNDIQTFLASVRQAVFQSQIAALEYLLIQIYPHGDYSTSTSICLSLPL